MKYPIEYNSQKDNLLSFTIQPKRNRRQQMRINPLACSLAPFLALILKSSFLYIYALPLVPLPSSHHPHVSAPMILDFLAILIITIIITLVILTKSPILKTKRNKERKKGRRRRKLLSSSICKVYEKTRLL